MSNDEKLHEDEKLLENLFTFLKNLYHEEIEGIYYIKRYSNIILVTISILVTVMAILISMIEKFPTILNLLPEEAIKIIIPVLIILVIISLLIGAASSLMNFLSFPAHYPLEKEFLSNKEDIIKYLTLITSFNRDIKKKVASRVALSICCVVVGLLIIGISLIVLLIIYIFRYIPH